MGIKLVDPVNLDGYFTTNPNCVLTFERDVWVVKDAQGNYSLHGLMKLYAEKDYGFPHTPVDEHPPIFQREISYDIAPDVLDTNLFSFMYGKMKLLYPTAVDC